LRKVKNADEVIVINKVATFIIILIVSTGLIEKVKVFCKFYKQHCDFVIVYLN
jgi:hypothetical protein